VLARPESHRKPLRVEELTVASFATTSVGEHFDALHRPIEDLLRGALESLGAASRERFPSKDVK